MLRESGEQTVAQRVEGVQRACGQQGAEGVHQLLCRSKAQLARFNIVPLCRRAHRVSQQIVRQKMHPDFFSHE